MSYTRLGYDDVKERIRGGHYKSLTGLKRAFGKVDITDAQKTELFAFAEKHLSGSGGSTSPKKTGKKKKPAKKVNTTPADTSAETKPAAEAKPRKKRAAKAAKAVKAEKEESSTSSTENPYERKHRRMQIAMASYDMAIENARKLAEFGVDVKPSMHEVADQLLHHIRRFRPTEADLEAINRDEAVGLLLSSLTPPPPSAASNGVGKDPRQLTVPGA